MIVAALIALGALVTAGLSLWMWTTSPPDATEVVHRLKDQGLPIGEVETYNAENDDPNELLGIPGQYTSKAFFKDTRLEPALITVQSGGSVEVFVTEEDAIRRDEYLRALSEAAPMFAEYRYRDDRVLLRLSLHLTPEQAEEYEIALQEVL